MDEVTLQILSFKIDGPEKNVVVSISDGNFKCTASVDKSCYGLFGSKIARLTIVVVKEYQLKKHNEHTESILIKKFMIIKHTHTN